MTHKSLALRRLKKTSKNFGICPFRNGDSPTVTMFEMFKRNCLNFQRLEKERERRKDGVPLYGCKECPLWEKTDSEITLDMIPPWVLIADDTEEKRAVFFQLKDNGIVQMNYCSLLVTHVRESKEMEEINQIMGDMVKEKEKELESKGIVDELVGERGLTSEESARRRKAAQERSAKKRKTKESMLEYTPLKLDETQQERIWEKHRQEGYSKLVIAKEYGVSDKVIANVIKKYDLKKRR